MLLGQMMALHVECYVLLCDSESESLFENDTMTPVLCQSMTAFQDELPPYSKEVE